MISGNTYGFYRCASVEERDDYEFPVDLDVIVVVESSPSVTYVGRNGVFKSITGSGTGGYDGDPVTIIQDATHRFVSDDQITDWDSKADALGADDNYVTDTEKVKLGNLSGTNSGDQDLSGLMVKANNLSDLANASTARTNLGINTTANQTDSADKRFMSDAQEAKVDAIDQVYTGTEKTKLSNITITQPVDLDDIESRVNNLDAAVVLKGTWDASAGTFPGGGTAQAGASYIVSVGGTVDSIVWAIGDRAIAILDNASTTTFTANWFKADYTDQVLSVNGSTGAVTLTTANVSDSADKRYCTDAQKTVIGNTSGTNTGDQSLSALALKATTITINGETQDLSSDRSWTITASSPESVYTSNIITSDTTIPADYSLIVRGRLKVNSGIRIKPALGASIMTI